ncbi:osmoprotectant transport system ATP-binding protein [Pelagirhabdus alkalitolerans]|uniref:Quaternary amine transport ATP-binding protein n=1 Tax=Pelagirhabdus alkalitolerans TaxID=1612202 RepID=A0A1G6ILC2_9BACI|nr:ABC transporter ATP-binding protein [Pelagirhabdus alkalitolerans]SDC07253.1 osmoprotectant transport system ATP-binding protein [Pelagirhabdus alkalitolerans]
MITFDNVTKTFPDQTTAINSIDLSIKKGEFFVLIGPSGCGKTTTLKTINRLIPISDGTILIDDRRISDYNINELRWNIGYVLQQIALFPHMTVAENIAIVPELKKWSAQSISKRTSELLDMVDLDPDTYKDRLPTELSGGEQQRIGVIRALAADPDIILMDEPFSALDPITREKLQDDMIRLQQNIKKTIVFVTHDIQEAVKLADRMAIMKNGQLVQVGTPEQIIDHPANDFVKTFTSNQKHHNHLKIETFVQETELDVDSHVSILKDRPLSELLRLLHDHEEVIVRDQEKVIGSIHRNQLIIKLADYYEKGGEFNESTH